MTKRVLLVVTKRETESRTRRSLAEGVGFEPTDGCPSLVFKTSAIDHSATLP